MNKNNPVTVTNDFTKNFNDIVSKFKRDAVLVGIPEEKGTRKSKDESSIGNAGLFAIANFGSPANNIPKWPIMSIGIKNAQEALSEAFKKAAIAVLTSGPSALQVYYERAGIIASTSIKKVINDQESKPSNRPLQSTLDARNSKGTKYWLVTGQMRNSITYVVKKGT